MVVDGDKSAAKEVTLASGQEIPVFTKPYEDREVKDQILIGAVKFFDGRKGFGFVKPDEEIVWDDVNSGDGIFFKRDSVITSNAGRGIVLRIKDGQRVSFKVYKDKKGLGACNIQNEDETPMKGEPRKERSGSRKKRKRRSTGNKVAKKVKTREELIEEREVEEEQNTYLGTVKKYNSKKEFGFIRISEEISFKDVTAKDSIFVMKDDIVSHSEEVGLVPDSEVKFKIYKDSKGLGACEVTNADGTPITFRTEEKAEEPSS